MAPDGVPAPPEARGREPPSFFFFHDLLTRWEKGFPSGAWSPWRGRGESPSEIGSVSLSLSVSAFWDSALSPFLIYPEIRNSDWIETFAKIFFRKLAFLLPKKSSNRLTGGPRGSGARPGGQARPLPRGHLGHRLTWIFLPEFSKYSKNKLHLFLSHLDSVRYGYSAKHKTCNKQELALGTGSIC